MVTGSPTDTTTAQVRASIAHPHLIRTRIQRSGRGPALVNELCSAPTLAHRIAGCPLSLRDAVWVVYDVGSAVEALAAHGLAPRDLSPESIHLHRTRGALLADAGVPAAIVPRAGVVSPSARGYLSPEELRGDPPDSRSLVYSLGALLRDSLPDNPPQPLSSVIDRATAENPDDRYRTPGGFAAAAIATVPGPGVVSQDRPKRPAPASTAREAPTDTSNGSGRPRGATPRAPAPRARAARPARPRPERPARPRPPRSSVRRLRAAAARASITVAAVAPRVSRPAPRISRPAPRPAVIAGGAAVLAGIIAILISGGTAGPDNHVRPRSTVASSAAFSLQLPPGWRADRPRGAGPLAPRTAVAAVSARDDARLDVGIVRDGRQLNRLMADAQTGGSARGTVRLGVIDAWRWTGVHVRGGPPVTLFVGYTSRGALVAMCPRPSGSAAGGCAALLSTLTLTGARPVPLASVERARQELGDEMNTLQRRWISGRARLAAARFAFDQAAGAQALEAAFRAASAKVAGIKTSPGTLGVKTVVNALDGTAGGYAKLGAAIVNADTAGYDEARADIVAREAELRRAAAGAAIP
jgi:hypothetical protein